MQDVYDFTYDYTNKAERENVEAAMCEFYAQVEDMGYDYCGDGEYITVDDEERGWLIARLDYIDNDSDFSDEEVHEIVLYAFASGPDCDAAYCAKHLQLVALLQAALIKYNVKH